MSNSNVVLITGVSSGIGRATSIKFSKQECNVFDTVSNKAKAQPIPGVELVEMDIRDDVSVQDGVCQTSCRVTFDQGLAICHFPCTAPPYLSFTGRHCVASKDKSLI